MGWPQVVLMECVTEELSGLPLMSTLAQLHTGGQEAGGKEREVGEEGGRGGGEKGCVLQVSFIPTCNTHSTDNCQLRQHGGDYRVEGSVCNRQCGVDINAGYLKGALDDIIIDDGSLSLAVGHLLGRRGRGRGGGRGREGRERN